MTSINFYGKKNGGLMPNGISNESPQQNHKILSSKFGSKL